MTSERRVKDRGDGQQDDGPASPLLARLAAIREAGTRLQLDRRDSTELLRELRDTLAQ